MSIAGWEDSLGDLVVPGDIVADKYRVDRIIGTGGMGVVVEAWHMHFEERVAIKFLMPQVSADVEAVTRFEREARAAFKIKSLHIARVLDVGKLPNSSPYMVMEYLEGRDLGDLLCDQHIFSVEQAVDFIIQAAEAVGEAHVLGIVHRDLKPENLFVTQRADGSACIKVLDFGLSKVAVKEGGGRQRALTGSSQVMGTPQYMSPEQWMSARNVGPAADIWALGTILFELVAGVQPFEQEQLAQLCTLVLTGSPPPLASHRPEAPPGLEQVILRCLAKEPESRWPNIAEFVAALCPFGTHEGLESAKRTVGVFRKSGIEVTTPPALADVTGPYSAQPAADQAPTTQPLPEQSLPEQPQPQLQPAQAQQPIADTSPLSHTGAGQPAEPGPPDGAGQPAVAGAHDGLLPQTESTDPQLATGDQPIPPAVAPLPARPSSEPSQSWQHRLDQQPAKKGAGKTTLAVVGALVIIGLGVGAISFAAYDDDGPAPATSAPPTASSAPAAPVASGVPATASATASAVAAAASGSGSALAAAAAPPPKVKIPPLKPSKPPVVPPTAGPSKPANQPKGSGSAFAYP